MFANFTAAARIPSEFEFIRCPRLLGRPCQAGFSGGWFRHEKPLRFRAGPAGAAQARPARENRADERRAARVARPRVAATRTIQLIAASVTATRLSPPLPVNRHQRPCKHLLHMQQSFVIYLWDRSL